MPRPSVNIPVPLRRDDVPCGPPFPSYLPPAKPPRQASDVSIRNIPETSDAKATGCDDQDGQYIVVPDSDLTERYQIRKLLSQDKFGRVVSAHDKNQNQAVTIKIVPAVEKYRTAAQMELQVLSTLRANDEENRNRCVHLRDYFNYRGHICIVTDLLDQNVFDLLKSNNYVPFPNSHIQSFAHRLLTSIAFLHDLQIVHTDVKPENIFLKNQEYKEIAYKREVLFNTQHRVLIDTEICLGNFYSATFEAEYHSTVVTTRQYRAPEVILDLGWSYPCDIWSIGCNLVEILTGKVLFPTHDNLEHLAMMEALLGTKIDSSLVCSVNESGSSSTSKYFKELNLNYPTPTTTHGSKQLVKAMKHLDDIIPAHNSFLRNLIDLLRKIFVYDPARRITAKEALNHPWFKELAQPDDGTEATRIKVEQDRHEKRASRVLPINRCKL